MTPTAANSRRIQLAKFMKMMIFVCWGLMAAGLASVVAAGHMSAGSLAALAGAILCLAAVFFMFFQNVRKWGPDSNDGLAGKELIFVFVFAAASLGLIVLTVILQ
jgi:hypothetical protein